MMKGWKKAAALGLTILSLSGTTMVFAAEVPAPAPKEGQSTSTRAEEVEWMFRTLADGTKQKRLWSHTRGIWLTEWQNV